jgi:hypothetical protein
VTLGETRRIELADQAAQTVQALGPITLPVPGEPQGCMRRVEFALKGGDGSVIATNYLDIAVHLHDFRSPDIGESGRLIPIYGRASKLWDIASSPSRKRRRSG